MLSLRDTASMREACLSTPDPCLRCLLETRIQQLGSYIEQDLGELVHFIIVEPGDRPPDVDRGLGFPFLRNVVDGTHFGDADFTPSFEWLQDHGAWFEVVFILSDDGFGTVVFIPDTPAIDFDLHAFCLTYSGRPVAHA